MLVARLFLQNCETAVIRSPSFFRYLQVNVTLFNDGEALESYLNTSNLGTYRFVLPTQWSSDSHVARVTPGEPWRDL